MLTRVSNRAKKNVLLLATMLLAVLSMPLRSEETSSRCRTIVDRVTVLDGRGGPALESARVFIDNGQITGIGSAEDALPDDAVEVIDGQGAYLVPGFIDMHAHLLFPRPAAEERKLPQFDLALSQRALAAQLSFGITTIRSPGAPTVEGLALRDALNSHKVPGPRAIASAELINDAKMSEEDLRTYVKDALKSRPDAFKVYSRLSPEQVAVVIDEAHQSQIPVIGHLQSTSWKEGLELGIDHLVHSVDWSAKSLPEGHRQTYQQAQKTRAGFRSRLDWLELFDMDSPEAESLLDLLVRRQVSVDVTLIAYDGKFSPPESTRYRDSTALLEFPELREDWEKYGGATDDWTQQDFQRWEKARKKLFSWVKKMSDRGVLLVTGTDLTNEWIAPGLGFHQELELLSEAGLTPQTILRMTGHNAAQALGSADIGVIEPGRRADLVLLEKDPRQDIRHTRSIRWVMQGGNIVPRPLPQRISPEL